MVEDKKSSVLDSSMPSLSSLTPPGGFSPPPPPPPGSSSSSSSKWPPGLSVHRATGRDELYLYSYGKQFGEKLTYSAGIGYAAGVTLGASYGLLLAVQKGGETARLRINAVLNGCSVHAPRLGSEFGALSLFYCCFNNALILARGESEYNAPLAGALSGLLYKCRGSWRLFSTYGVASSLAFTAIDQYMRSKRLAAKKALLHLSGLGAAAEEPRCCCCGSRRLLLRGRVSLHPNDSVARPLSQGPFEGFAAGHQQLLLLLQRLLLLLQRLLLLLLLEVGGRVRVSDGGRGAFSCCFREVRQQRLLLLLLLLQQRLLLLLPLLQQQAFSSQ